MVMISQFTYRTSGTNRPGRKRMTRTPIENPPKMPSNVIPAIRPTFRAPNTRPAPNAPIERAVSTVSLMPVASRVLMNDAHTAQQLDGQNVYGNCNVLTHPEACKLLQLQNR